MNQIRSNKELMRICDAVGNKVDLSKQEGISPLPPLQYLSPDDITRILIFVEDSILYVIYPGTMGKPKLRNPLKVGFLSWIRNPITGLSDWERDFDFTKKGAGFNSKNSKIKAHEGFVKEYTETRDNLMDIVNKTDPALIVVAGYSQGGAHATLCFRDLIYNYPKIPVVGVTFASPRVYNFYGAKEFEKELKNRQDCRFTRFIRAKDIVPTVAPPIFDFKHVVPATVVGKPTWSIIHTVQDHFPAHYIDNL